MVHRDPELLQAVLLLGLSDHCAIVRASAIEICRVHAKYCTDDTAIFHSFDIDELFKQAISELVDTNVRKLIVVDCFQAPFDFLQ